MKQHWSTFYCCTVCIYLLTHQHFWARVTAVSTQTCTQEAKADLQNRVLLPEMVVRKAWGCLQQKLNRISNIIQLLKGTNEDGAGDPSGMGGPALLQKYRPFKKQCSTWYQDPLTGNNRKTQAKNKNKKNTLHQTRKRNLRKKPAPVTKRWACIC